MMQKIIEFPVRNEYREISDVYNKNAQVINVNGNYYQFIEFEDVDRITGIQGTSEKWYDAFYHSSYEVMSSTIFRYGAFTFEGFKLIMQWAIKKGVRVNDISKHNHSKQKVSGRTF